MTLNPKKDSFQVQSTCDEASTILGILIGFKNWIF